MSQHYLQTKEKSIEVFVGFDRPLHHFFAQGFRDGEPFEITPLFRGVDNVDDLARATEPYATIPEHVLQTLLAERDGTSSTNVIIDHRKEIA